MRACLPLSPVVPPSYMCCCVDAEYEQRISEYDESIRLMRHQLLVMIGAIPPDSLQQQPPNRDADDINFQRHATNNYAHFASDSD